jgi:hypothetical protein
MSFAFTIAISPFPLFGPFYHRWPPGALGEKAAAAAGGKITLTYKTPFPIVIRSHKNGI